MKVDKDIKYLVYFFGYLKDDFYTFYNPQSKKELFENLDEYIKYYNEERIQLRLKMSLIQYMNQNS